MDGPNLNKSFASKLKAVLNAIATLFIDIGTCPLHTANNAFSDDLNYLKNSIDLDEFGIYFHFFFKHSTARREDYKDVSSITEVTLHFVLRHCQWRWLSFDNVTLHRAWYCRRLSFSFFWILKKILTEYFLFTVTWNGWP